MPQKGTGRWHKIKRPSTASPRGGRGRLESTALTVTNRKCSIKINGLSLLGSINLFIRLDVTLVNSSLLILLNQFGYA